MIKLLIKKFIPNFDDTDNTLVREKYGVLSGTLGIVCNLLLFIVKIIIGIIMNSIAIISDAFNSLSDTASSIVTVISSKLSNKEADKEHPFGHGRIEYVASLVVSFMIMLFGFELLTTSIGKLLVPNEVVYNRILLIILVLTVIVKLWMFSYNKYMGKLINSNVLKATATDSLNDVLTTAIVILSVVLGKFVTLPVDAIAGIFVACFILFAGIRLFREIVGLILGAPPDEEVVNNIKDTLLSNDHIIGIHDLIVHEYGPGTIMATVHAEVSDDENIVDIHNIIDEMEREVLKDHGIMLVIHIDPLAIHSEEVRGLWKYTKNMIKEFDSRLTAHDFRVNEIDGKLDIKFDLVVPVDIEDKEKLVSDIKEKLCSKDDRIEVTVDVDNAY
ncbi:MAG: cation transporter [Clostridia bacterium]|nr:cation transporter [Clostridia bacterium]